MARQEYFCGQFLEYLASETLMLRIRSIVVMIQLNITNQINILKIDSHFDAKYACEVITHMLFI